MLEIKELPDVTLVKNVKNSACSDSFIKLSERHSNLFYKICGSYLKRYSALGGIERDLLEDKDQVILDSINKFKEEKKVKFSSWLGICTRFYCLNKINKLKRTPEIVNTEEAKEALENVPSTDTVDYNEVNIKSLLSIISKHNNEKMIRIFRLRYDDKKVSWKKIASELNISVKETQRLHSNGIKFVKDRFKNKTRFLELVA